MKNKLVYLYVIAACFVVATALSVGLHPDLLSQERSPRLLLKILDWTTNIIGTASASAALTPTKRHGVLVEAVRKLLELLALKYGYVRAETMKNGRRGYDQ